MSEMATYGVVPQKIDLTPRKFHGYAVLLFIMGTLFPPLAVAARFGIGKDFWINLLLTICGYIPGHGHNFYIQNIRNNKNHARTPKWVQKYGLVDLSEIRRKERKSQWAGRYKDRLPNSAYEGQPLAEGQEGSTSDIASLNGQPKRRNTSDGLWQPEDEQYYNTDQNSANSGGGRWHYPANFDDAVMDSAMLKKSKKKSKSDKKNRWERTQDAYSLPPDDEDTGRKKKSKKKKRRSSVTTDSIQSQDDSVQEYPEDPEGGLYGNSSRLASSADDRNRTKDEEATKTSDDIFKHQF
ncbi:hypothetical protein EST38_g10785 [Candolleomyces aberdarensis]|uniref:Uncharacterized protein n=1 Tax=Candolleomyces aberdarensis TaxID=2316362 RepID=A0A4Q2D6H9_9AGAR|nr:hypothetical protein EST38_g10785 [Candolleomyces aberdarensis]